MRRIREQAELEGTPWLGLSRALLGGVTYFTLHYDILTWIWLFFQSQESPNPENIANPLEGNVTKESISSKKKEKRKHVDHVESSLFVAPGSIQSSDDLEEDTSDHCIPSRYFIHLFSRLRWSWRVTESFAVSDLMGWEVQAWDWTARETQLHVQSSFSTPGFPHPPSPLPDLMRSKMGRMGSLPSLLTLQTFEWKLAVSSGWLNHR